MLPPSVQWLFVSGIQELLLLRPVSVLTHARMSRLNIWEQSANKSASHVVFMAIGSGVIAFRVASLTGSVSAYG
ncbi:hypothetical protein UP74_05750 [Escherichia coli]|nr:hypothetical protein UP74_05750 [Escherichia coli]